MSKQDLSFRLQGQGKVWKSGGARSNLGGIQSKKSSKTYLSWPLISSQLKALIKH